VSADTGGKIRKFERNVDNQNLECLGGGEGEYLFGNFYPQLFFQISSHAKNQHPSMRKVIRRDKRRRRREEKKPDEFSGHYICLAAHLESHPGSARTFIRILEYCGVFTPKISTLG
jgi:hypothetical protein